MISILYIDDETSLLKLGKIFIERQGDFSVDITESARNALSLLAEKHYDAIISDYQMPGMNGIELLKEVRKTDALTPFIIFTGRGREDVVIEAINNGADFYLQKGGEPATQYFELISKITQAVQRRKAEAELVKKHDELSAAYEELAGQQQELQSQMVLLAQQEKALQMSEENMREIAETLPGVVYQYYARSSGETGFYFVSGRADEIFGISGELKGFFDHFVQGVSADSRQAFIDSIRHAIEEEKRWEYEGKYIRPDGTEIDFRGISEPVGRGDEIVFSGVVLDITREKQAERIVLAEKELSLLLASTSSLEEAYKYCLEKAITLSGMDSGGFYLYEPETGSFRLVYSLGLTDSFVREVRTISSDSTTGKIARAGNPVYTEYQHLNMLSETEFRRKEGLRSTGVIPVIHDGMAVACLNVASHTVDRVRLESRIALETIASDIWNAIIRIQGEQELKESEERFTRLSEAALEAILVHQEEVIQDLNQQACLMFGNIREEMIGQNLYSLFPGNSAEQVKNHLQSHGQLPVEVEGIRSDGSHFWAELSSHPITYKQKEQTLTTIWDITHRKKMEEVLEKRILTLTRPPVDSLPVEFSDLFDINEIQQIQDVFSDSTGVAALITTPEGIPITRPSNFCRLYNEIIRTTEKGRRNCYQSDAEIGRNNPSGPVVQPCLNGGLWNAGAGITVGGRHIANWLIGQVRNEQQDEEKMLAYADEIGVDRDEFRRALADVPVMSQKQFEKVAESLYLFANKLSVIAYQNIQQARVISELSQTKEALQRANQQLALLSSITRHDIKNKITVLLGYIALAEEMTEDPGLAPFIWKIHETVLVIRDQIEFTRVYQDLGTQMPQWMKIRDMLFQEEIPAGITVENDIPEVLIRADPLLERVFAALQDNSVRHGEKVSRIRASSREIAQDLIITWEDDGIGIPPGEKELIFQSGYGKNTGFGLFLSAEVLKITDITIRECGIPGEGALFEIRVPRNGWKKVNE